MEYEPPPAFAPPDARSGPLTPEEAMALLYPHPAVAAPRPPEAPRTPWALITGAVVVVGVVLVWALLMLTRVSRQDVSQARLSLPDTAGSYQLMRTVDGHAVAVLFAQELGSLGSLEAALDTAQVGVYRAGASGPATLLFVGFNAADSTAVDQLLGSNRAMDVTAQLLSGAGALTPAFLDPGPWGGALQCAHGEQGGAPVTPCAWADRATIGVVLQLGSVDFSSAGSAARAFRAAAEH